MSHKVAILMSTYNGEKYLDSQIKSIISQTYINWHLYIRDDGSQDRTTNIVKSYANSDDRITFFNPNHVVNVGVTKSFMGLLRDTKADFYMFCDQDDVWLPNKVELSVQRMVHANFLTTPLCIFSELQVVDQALHPLRLMNGNNVWFDLPHFLVGNCVTGCTMMINQSLKDALKIDQTKFDQIYLHDWWIALVTSITGKLLYISQPTIKYRQHANNVEGSKSNNILTLAKRTLNLTGERSQMIRILKMDAELQRLFKNHVHGKDQKYLAAYVNLLKHPSLTQRIKTLLTTPPKRAHFKGNLLFSLLILSQG